MVILGGVPPAMQRNDMNRSRRTVPLSLVVDVVQYGLEISKHVVMFNSYSSDPSVCMMQTSTQPEAHSFCGRVFISVIPMRHS